MNMKAIVITLSCLALASAQHAAAQMKPIALHPVNRHYFEYGGKPLILITSGEHYGSVLNLDLDYKKYLTELASKNLNLTRVFTGVYVEPQGAFNIEKNGLAPAPNRYASPWRRSKQPGYRGGGNKFDLSKWDHAYFARLKDFVRQAEQRNIIVELTMFCPFYEMKQWVLSPMHPDNNINSIPTIGKDSVYTLDHNGPLLRIQEQLVVKIVTELNAFSNVIFEICNEPYFGGVSMDWQYHVAALIQETERSLHQKHLISQNIANDSARIHSWHAAVSVFNFHYATPPTAVKQNYHLNRVIGDNETGFRGQADSTYRKEGWEFILAGGGLYNNLDYSFAPGFEDGTLKYNDKTPGGGSVALREQLGQLRKFMEGFNFVAMSPDTHFRIMASKPPRMHMLSEAGQQYAAYILHGERATVALPLPMGKYEVDWIDPATGKTLASEVVTRADSPTTSGDQELQSPPYQFDIALRIVRMK
jgi:hypothetical protein